MRLKHLASAILLTSRNSPSSSSTGYGASACRRKNDLNAELATESGLTLAANPGPIRGRTTPTTRSYSSRTTAAAAA
jgi:hypothetical protein